MPGAETLRNSAGQWQVSRRKFFSDETLQIATSLQVCGSIPILVTLIELLFFLVMIALGFGLAKASYAVGGMWLAVPSFIIGVALIPFALFLHVRYRKWAYVGDKFLPPCRCGSDKLKYEKVGTEYHLLCQNCRTRYERQRDEVFVYDNGGRKPYKRLVKWKGWTDEF